MTNRIRARRERHSQITNRECRKHREGQKAKVATPVWLLLLRTLMHWVQVIISCYTRHGNANTGDQFMFYYIKSIIQYVLRIYEGCILFLVEHLGILYQLWYCENNKLDVDISVTDLRLRNSLCFFFSRYALQRTLCDIFSQQYSRLDFKNNVLKFHVKERSF